MAIYYDFKKYKIQLEKRIIKRCEKDLEKGYINTAISRYQGFLKFDFNNQNIRNQLAILLIEVGNNIQAGRNLYFKENPSILEKECIILFERSCGNCPLIIAKKLLSSEQSIQGLDDYSQNRLYQLIIATEIKFNLTPKFLIGRKGTLKRLRNDRHK